MNYDVQYVGVPISITDVDRYSKEIVRSGVNLSWKDLSMTSTKHGHSQKVLRKCCGISYSGEILAVMGASGSGKTTLVTLLADQFLSQDDMKFTGEVRLNDVKIARTDFSQYVKFVSQSASLLPTLTARESLKYTALLQCVASEREVDEYVARIIEDMNMEKFADCIIGDTMIRGMSGGEKKLVTIANEMISQPSVLILDEPTSGLDSSNALKIMNVLKEQAALGKNIILTIHQPSSTIFEMLDRLLLVTCGRCVYLGRTMDAYRYFAMLDYLCPTHINPCDYFMRITYFKDFFHMTDEESVRFKKLVISYRELQEVKIKEDIQFQIQEAKGIDRRIILPSNSKKVEVLMRMSFVNSKRHPLLFTMRIVQSLFLSILTITIYNNIGKDLNSIQSRTGLIFFDLEIIFMLSTNMQLLIMQSERILYIKSIKQGHYGIMQYFFSKFLAEIPNQLLFVFLFSTIQYFAVPFNTSSPSKFFIFLGIAELTHVIGAGLGYLCGALANSTVEALILGSAIGWALMMVAGFFSNQASMPMGTNWLRYLSPFSYAFDALAINEYTDLALTVDIDPLAMLNITGSLNSKVEALIAIEVIYISITLIILKVKEIRQFKKRALL